MRISDWSADVCSSDLFEMRGGEPRPARQRRAVDREQRAPLGAEREPGGFEHEARHRQRIERERCALAIDPQPPRPVDRQSAVSGNSVSVRAVFGGRRLPTKKKTTTTKHNLIQN